MRGLWRLRFTHSDNEPPRDEDVRSGDVPCRGVLRATYLRPMICLSMVDNNNMAASQAAYVYTVMFRVLPAKLYLI